MKPAWRSVAAGAFLAAVATLVIAGPAHADLTPGPTDLEATAVPAHGKVGDTVKVRLNANNLGPHITTVDEGVVLRYVAPTGTELADDFASLPYCHIVNPRHEAWCYEPAQLWPAPAGTYEGFDISITIDSATVAPGLFTIECSCDTNPSNNSAKLVVTVDGVTAPSTPGPRPTSTARPTRAAGSRPTLAVDSSASPIATPSADGSTSPILGPVAIASASSSPAPAVAVASARSTGTNVPVGPVAAIAGCLAVIGAAIFKVVRRR